MTKGKENKLRQFVAQALVVRRMESSNYSGDK